MKREVRAGVAHMWLTLPLHVAKAHLLLPPYFVLYTIPSPRIARPQACFYLHAARPIKANFDCWYSNTLPLEVFTCPVHCDFSHVGSQNSQKPNEQSMCLAPMGYELSVTNQKLSFLFSYVKYI